MRASISALACRDEMQLAGIVTVEKGLEVDDWREGRGGVVASASLHCHGLMAAACPAVA
jgi:hypothetical protein